MMQILSLSFLKNEERGKIVREDEEEIKRGKKEKLTEEINKKKRKKGDIYMKSNGQRQSYNVEFSMEQRIAIQEERI